MQRDAAVPTYLKPEIPVLDLHPDKGDLRAEVVAGLSKPGQRTLPCKWFYDEEGSQLFDRITELPEYYQTRTELGILRQCAGALARRLGERITLIEYGSGSSLKTGILLGALDVATYVPIDISRWYLQTSAERLRGQFPSLSIRPVVADYTAEVRLPDGEATSRNCVGFFPGSTIGNFGEAGAIAFLRRAADTLGSGGHLLVGVDLKKDPLRLHAAYNDSAGITAAFNLNLLARLNREVGSDFDLAAWRHYAPYNVIEGRIEMHLVSLRDQTVHVGDHAFDFEAGQSLHTENSYKYTAAQFARLAEQAGIAVEEVWTDPENLFSVQLLRVVGNASGNP